MSTYVLDDETVAPPLRGVMGAVRDSLDAYQTEIDDCYTEMKTFGSMDPDEIFLKLAAWLARAGEIRSRLARQETRKEQAFRSRQVEPFIDDCKLQFQIHSRRVAVLDVEARLAGRVI